MKAKFLRNPGLWALAAMICALPASAEQPKEAICAMQQAVACGSFEACERALPAGVNLPALFRFNLETGTIESRRDDGEVRTSKIASSSTGEDAVVMQGIDEGTPWTIRVSTKTGKFTLNVLRDDEGFLGFGVCSAKILK